jgi:hypothetical protein
MSMTCQECTAEEANLEHNDIHPSDLACAYGSLLYSRNLISYRWILLLQLVHRKLPIILFRGIRARRVPSCDVLC